MYSKKAEKKFLQIFSSLEHPKNEKKWYVQSVTWAFLFILYNYTAFRQELNSHIFFL